MLDCVVRQTQTVTDTPFCFQFANYLKVVTETCHLFFLSDTEESLELVLFAILYHTLSFTIAQICCTCVLAAMWQHYHTQLLTTPFIAFGVRTATVSARLLNCSTLVKFGSEFG